ncbi:alcohol dehydrogenase [Evansella vedderi]|uniref:Alcohol dehydrogenase n=1 Tax=Evansella vedderi TaxID=38282 RepID=A0ABT9ZTC2_9BACI|nr:iron-containing alcohol dehydrogenase [Evansella vedderi]MDQ0254094.1 alcohol dehydrogenase [Evansella vedderi]
MDIFEIPQRIVSGWGVISTIGKEAASLGKKVIIVHSRRLSKSSLLQDAIYSLNENDCAVMCIDVPSGEPTIEMVEIILKKAERHNCDLVIGIGGGSILDIAKAVAGLKFTNRTSVKEYFYGHQITNKGIPWVAIPTTSGAGSEATPNSVLSDEKNIKQSIRGDKSWLASIVILDPQLTVSCSKNVTAWSGMDALTQAIESYTSIGANVLTEPYSLESAKLIAKSLFKAYEYPEDKQARTDMAQGSLLAGIALGNARLGIVHGVAHSIGLHFNVPHGLVCGTLLPWAITYNEKVCSEKYIELAKTMKVGNSVNALKNWIIEMNSKMNIPSSIKEFGVTHKDLKQIVMESMPSGSLKANPRKTSEEELSDFLEKQL